MERDDKKRMIKVADEVQIAEVKVIAKGQSKSKIIVTADVSKEKEKEREKEKELAARIMKNLCEEAEAECKLVQQ